MIIGIGELLWDVFPDGYKVAGGAPFNFAFHCKQLGHDAVIVSRVGDDDLGRELRAEVRRLGLTDEFIQTDRAFPTGRVRVRVDAHGQPAYEIVEGVAWDYIECDDRLRHLAPRAKLVCHGSLALRCEEGRRAIRQFVKFARQSSAVRVFDANLREPYVDPVVLQKELYGLGWVKLNADEQRRLAALYGVPDDELIRNGFRIGDRNGVWVVTNGADGARVVTREAEWTVPGVPATMVDTVGAGDAFTAALTCLRIEGRSLPQAARFAAHYAARVCEHQGGTPRLDRREIERQALRPWWRFW